MWCKCDWILLKYIPKQKGRHQCRPFAFPNSKAITVFLNFSGASSPHLITVFLNL